MAERTVDRFGLGPTSFGGLGAECALSSSGQVSTTKETQSQKKKWVLPAILAGVLAVATFTDSNGGLEEAIEKISGESKLSQECVDELVIKPASGTFLIKTGSCE